MGEDDNLFMTHSAPLPFLSFGGEERKENTLEGKGIQKCQFIALVTFAQSC